jgi:hypothetical protein
MSTTRELSTLLDEIRKDLSLDGPEESVEKADTPLGRAIQLRGDDEIRSLMLEKRTSIVEEQKLEIKAGQRLAVQKAFAARRSKLGRLVYLEAVRKFITWPRIAEATPAEIARAEASLYHERGNEGLLSLVSTAERAARQRARRR